jgi:hypothetical protein
MRYMVQIDTADQSKVGVRDGSGITLAFASGPFKRTRFFTRKGAERFAAKHPTTRRVFRRGWVNL